MKDEEVRWEKEKYVKVQNMLGNSKNMYMHMYSRYSEFNASGESRRQGSQLK